ncbi:MAG TPA: UDP-N-acetylglucosamine 2-epimerase [bacterium]|nr:UDP-N-acetylglucosamine 2-epimerase [bacterium]
MKRRVAIYTGNRSDYGLLHPVISAIAARPELKYYLIVSGAHLKTQFGRTISEIRGDGFLVYARAAVSTSGDSLPATARAVGKGILALVPILDRLRPHFLLVHGDRFETLAAVIAGSQLGIPIAHIEGGDYTEGGALDDSVRHAITKLAHLHFTTNRQAAERVRRLGEEPWRIHTVGLPSLDLIAAGSFAPPAEVFRRLSLSPSRPVLVFTQHSVATQFDRGRAQVRPSLAALSDAVRAWDCQVVITYPNDDAGGRRMLAEMRRFAADHPSAVRLIPSLGRHLYHGVLNVAAACVGNSSSGIKETPAFRCACVNIGSRQQGRLRSSNILDVDYNREQIRKAVERCLHDRRFLARVRTCRNPYGQGQAGRCIAEVLASVPLEAGLVQKRMTF